MPKTSSILEPNATASSLDILKDGTAAAPRSDEGDLAAEYGLSDDDAGNGDKTKAANTASGPFVPPKSSGGDQEPRRYA